MMRPRQSNLKLAFYGDDFTGSTDALDFLNRAGLRSVLFIDPPDNTTMSKHPDVEAIGIAGMTRALSPSGMKGPLMEAFTRFKELRPAFVHYKVCSTFDSSPERGSIGEAIAQGAAVFPAPCVPVVAGQPALGRYTVFGNLFAQMGTGPDGAVYRIDQHPSMSRHPTTPARDGDLRDHLARQTAASMGLLDILAIKAPEDICRMRLIACLNENPEILFLDIDNTSQFSRIGQLLHDLKPEGETLFTVGSSAIEAALCAIWTEAQPRESSAKVPLLEPVESVCVFSGSCSPVTSGQIETAVAAGFRDYPVDIGKALTSYPDSSYISQLATAMATDLKDGRSIVAHSSSGPGDPRFSNDPAASGDALGTFLGRLASRILEEAGARRIGFAGGDSSSHAARAMGITAIEPYASFTTGAPVCRAFSRNPVIDGLQVNFKGGQVGSPDYFIQLRDGTSIQ